MPRALDPTQLQAFIGREFGRLTVVSLHSHVVYPCGAKGTKWTCRCVCGAETKVTRANLIGGHSASCGCLHRDKQTKHGVHRVPGYRSWVCMMRRCTVPEDKDFPRYGGRGITVCPRWHSPVAFLEDMGVRPSAAHTIDRIDPAGDYTPQNCRWATATEQARNRNMIRKNTSGVTGVSWSNRRQAWTASIQAGGKSFFLGRFATIEEAARARQAKAAELGFGPHHGVPRHANG